VTAATGGTLGILAGGGELPLRVARAAKEAGRPVFAVVMRDWGEPAQWAGLPHTVERPGAAGRILKQLRGAKVRQIVLTGHARRPSVTALRPDAYGLRVIARIGAAFFLGDDGLLRAVARVLEEEGFEVVSPQSVLAGLLPESGLLGRAPAPDKTARADIRRGIDVCRALGAVDVGQAVVVQQGLVLGVEAIEGTDALLARCSGLRREGGGGVLVKLAKPGQDRRLDLPAVGPETVRNAAAAGLAGIAFGAGATVLLDRERTVAAADAAGLFLLALSPDETTNTEDTAP
jgi:UDP-2,3-diacylglucosamine hydrolase